MMYLRTIGLIIICVFFLGCPTHPDGSLYRIRDSGEVRIAMSGDYPPFSYYNEKKVLDGMVTDRVAGDNAIRSGKFDIQFLGAPLRNRKVAIGLRKEDKALLREIESVLEDMRKEGVLQNLIKKVAQCEYNCATAF